MGACAIAPDDKRRLARAVGKHLVGTYGKRRAYPPAVIRATMRRLAFPDGWDCWALSLFASADDFASYHASSGEVCDYASMHAAMLGDALADSLGTDFFSFAWLGDAGSGVADAAVHAADLGS